MTVRANHVEDERGRRRLGRGESAYSLDPRIARELGIVPLDGGTVATCNGKGIQMAAQSPLLDVWIGSFDGARPLVDIGAAYGANAIPAAHAGADVLAIDCHETHLEYLRRAWKPGRTGSGGSLYPVLASLPEVALPGGVQASGILCAEVIHFLTGPDVERSFDRFYDLLIPGGLLCLTCADVSSMYLQDLYEERRKAGHPWPGQLEPEEFAALIRHMCVSANLPDHAIPDYMHAFSADQIAEVAERAGFRVISCEARMHPGYPEEYHGEFDTPNVQLVAFRPRRA